MAPKPRPRPVYPTAIVVVGWKHRSAHTQFEQHLYLALAVGRFSSSSSSSSSLGWQFLLLYRFASQNGSGGGRVEQGEDTVCCWGARVPAVSGGPRGIYYLFFHPTPALFIHDWVTDWLVGGLGWFMVGAYRWRWRMRVSLLLVLVVQTEWWCPLSFHDSPPTQQWVGVFYSSMDGRTFTPSTLGWVVNSSSSVAVWKVFPDSIQFQLQHFISASLEMRHRRRPCSCFTPCHPM